MAARRKSSSVKSSQKGSFFTKDLFIFIVIMALVAYITYVLTVNAITAKIDTSIGLSPTAQTQAK